MTDHLPIWSRLSRWYCGLLLVSAASLSPASEICEDPGVVFGYFNGVQTSEQQARDTVRHFLAPAYGPTTPAGHPITYDLFYNDTEGLADFAETFDQRLREHDAVLTDRFELFFAVVIGDRGGWWGSLIQAVPAAGALFSDLLETVMAKALQELTRGLGDPSLAAVSQRHREQIDRWTAQDRKLLLFAHSQGNLFVNAAYAHALGRTDAASVRVVHVAPASPTLSGRHTLADKDIVINGLRAAGTVVPNTDIIVGYATRPAGVNGRRDLLGHGLLEVYLNAALSTSARLLADVDHALSELDAAPRKPWQPYPDFFAPEWLAGEQPQLVRQPDEASHVIVKIDEASDPWPYEYGLRGWAVAWHLHNASVTGWATARYTGKGVSGFIRCDWGEDVARGWTGTKFPYIDCSFDGVPNLDSVEEFHPLQVPEELQGMRLVPYGTVVWLHRRTFTYAPTRALWVGERVEGTIGFSTGRRPRWVDDYGEPEQEILKEWTEPYWRTGGDWVNLSEYQAWKEADRSYQALLAAELARYWEAYWEHERRRLSCGRQ